MRRKHWYGLAIAAGILLLWAAVAIPNLNRSRMAAPQSAARNGVMTYLSAPMQKTVAETTVADDMKIVRTATLELVCRNVGDAVTAIRAVTTSVGGYVENADFTQANDTSQAATFVLRVPATQLDTMLEELKHTAVRVQRENLKSDDVTRRYVDTESRLRNYHAEEEQYLAIMKRAGSVKDTLAVAEKLSEVRGTIEQVQGELNYLSRQVEMAAINVTVSQQVSSVASWRPGENARRVWHDMLAALGDYADTIVALILWLPVILLWVATIGGALFIGRKMFSWARRWHAVSHGPAA